MQVTVKKTGGNGSPATDEAWDPLSTSELGGPGTEIESLLDKANFFELSQEFPPVGPNRFAYAITAEDGGRNHSVSFSEDNEDVPE